MHALLY